MFNVNTYKSKEIVLTRKDCDHLILNSLQIIKSLLSLHSRSGYNIDKTIILKKAENRINVLSTIYKLIYDSEYNNRLRILEYIKDVTGVIKSTCNDSCIQMYYNIDDLYLSHEVALPFCLTLYEILSNAFNHAFPNSHNNRAHVELNVELSKLESVICTISDNGIGIPNDMTDHSSSLGIPLSRLLIEQQLNGEFNIHSNSGTTVIMSFPFGLRQ